MRSLARHGSVLVLSALMLGACATIRHGGAPEPSFDTATDLAQLEAHFANATSIEDFYTSPSQEARNRFIDGRLVMMNIRYIEFLRGLTSDKQVFDSAAEMLVLSLNIASTGFSSASTKTILSGLAAGMAGSKDIVDKNFFFEKTVPALITSMDAERKRVLVRILTGREKELNQYTMTHALTDLYEYYHAGTLFGAINTIQAEASVKSDRQDRAIREIAPVSQQQLFAAFEFDLTRFRLGQRITAGALQDIEAFGLEQAYSTLAISLDVAESVLGQPRRPRNPGELLTVIWRYYSDDPEDRRSAIADALSRSGVTLVTTNVVTAHLNKLQMSDAAHVVAMLGDIDNSYTAPANIDTDQVVFDGQKEVLVQQFKKAVEALDDRVVKKVGEYLIDNTIIN